MEGPSALVSAERRLVDIALASWDTLCSTPCLRWLLRRRRRTSALCEVEEARAALVVPIWSREPSARVSLRMSPYSPSRCPAPQADVFYSDDDADGFAAGTSCSSPGARRGSLEQSRSSFDRRRASLDRPSLSRASLDRVPPGRASLDCNSSLALPAQHWANGEWQSYRLRGPSYLSGPRLKTSASQPACTLVGVDLCSTPHSQRAYCRT